MNRNFTLVFAAGLFALSMAGCSQSDSTPAAAELGEIDESGSKTTAVSEEQAKKFAKLLEDALAGPTPAAAGSLILSDRIIDRVATGLGLSGKLESQFRTGLTGSNPVTGMMVQLGKAVQAGGSYSLVRTVVRGSNRHAIFRMLDNDGNLNYHDFRLVLNGDVAKADQMFVAATGESIADTLISAYAPSISAQQSTMQRVTGDAAKKGKELELKAKMMTAARAGNTDEALRIYETLSSTAQNSKTVQLARVMASQGKSEAEYLQVLSDYTSRFPNDPSVALISFDKSILEEDLPGIKNCIAMLDKWTGGDDYLKLLTASVVCGWGEFDYAKELYTAAKPENLGILDAHNYKLFAALQCKDFPVALNEMRVMRDDYAFDFDVDSNAVFAEFKQSTEFKEWQNDSN